jgi:type IV secretory pathway TraG/TraD family ATPase VirD4
VENEMMRNIIGQTKSSFNFREIMDSGKILLVNLSKGKTGEVNASLLGLILVAKLQMAAFTRADIPEPERKDFYLYIDEFQNFVTPSIATILSEARKYRLNLVMAHQYMGQLTKDNKTEIWDAVGRSSAPATAGQADTSATASKAQKLPSAPRCHRRQEGHPANPLPSAPTTQGGVIPHLHPRMA